MPPLSANQAFFLLAICATVHVNGFFGLKKKKVEPKATVEIEVSDGSGAALTEHGYELVADLKSDTEMAIYISRVLADEGKKVRVDCIGDLMGLVPYYSGTRARQSLAKLRAELNRASWAVRATSVEADQALDTLKSKRLSTLSNASAYALAIAGALSSQSGRSHTRVLIEAELDNQPMATLVESLREAMDDGAQVVIQRKDGRVVVTNPQELALDLANRPLHKWTQHLNTKRREATDTRWVKEQQKKYHYDSRTSVKKHPWK